MGNSIKLLVEAKYKRSIIVPYKQYDGTTKTGRFGIKEQYYKFDIYKKAGVFGYSRIYPYIKHNDTYITLLLPNILSDGSVCFGTVKSKTHKTINNTLEYYIKKFWEVPFNPYDVFGLITEAEKQRAFSQGYCCKECNGSKEKWEEKFAGILPDKEIPEKVLRKLFKESNESTDAIVKFIKGRNNRYKELTFEQITTQ
jgi:hypothetical protein